MAHSLPGWLRRKTRQGQPDSEAVSGLIESGIAAESRGEDDAAERLFRQAVALAPLSARAHMNLGIALQRRDAFDTAAASHAEAVRLDPALASAHFNLALAFLGLDKLMEAESAFRSALHLRPAFPEALVGLGEVLELLGKDGEALEALEHSIELSPDHVGARFNAAMLLRKLGRLDEAEAILRHIPVGHPGFVNAATALAAVLRDQGRIDEAVEALRSALRLSPGSSVTQSELLFTLGFSSRVSAEQLFSEHLAAGARLEASLPSHRDNFMNVPDPDRVLNIGYLSGDFRRHSVASFTEFLFTRHRRDRVRVYAYSSTPQKDQMTERFITTADVWRDVRGQTDSSVSGTIVADRIDLLVDLSGHTSGSRVGVLAGRAAPVQLTWLGYINSTGLRQVDYRITDSIADPPGLSESLHTEQLLRMPHAQWCFRPSETALRTPLERDFSDPRFTFGALNQFAKVSEDCVALWVAVLKAAPAARLRVVNVPRGSATDALIRRFSEKGIDQARYDIVERVPHALYYAQYARVDACLDSTPYSGGTTTCDALFLGVPVITLAGHRPISRSSASLLAAVGMAEMIALSTDEFVEIACKLATGGPWPTGARIALRQKMLASPLMDEEAFTHDLEALYRRAWRDWCRRQNHQTLHS